MAISSTDVTAGPYTTNGATTEFSFSFRVADYGGVEGEDQVKVILVTASTGAETVLTRGVGASQYVVTLNGDQDSSPGGTVTMGQTYAAGYYVYIRLKPTFTQATELQNQGAYDASVVEAQFDEQQRQILDLRDQLRRAPVPGVQIGESFTGEITGTPVAGYLPQLNAGLTGWTWVANNGSSNSVTPTGGSTARTLADWFADVAVCFATYAEMTAATYLVDNAVYFVYGRASEEDGGSGFFRFDAASTATVDGGTILAKDGGGAGRFFRLYNGTGYPEWFGSSAAWGAAITAAAAACNEVKFRPGTTYTWDDSQVVIDKSNFTLDCRGATIQPKYASAAAFKFGNSTTQRQNITVMGGTWNQRPASDGGPTQALFDLRGVRAFYTINCFGVNIYQLARWGLPADDINAYKWWNVGCEWNGRINANGGHTDFIQADGSDGGFYNIGSTCEGDAANIASEVVFMRFTSSQAPERFDHADFASGIVKGFDGLIEAEDARVVNIELGGGFRCDDIGSYAFRVDVSSGATKGGCENVRLHCNFGGLGPGGICSITNAHASVVCEDITIVGAGCNEAAGTVCNFATTGSGKISAVHINGLHISDYDPTDGNQDAIIFSGDIDESSIKNISLDGKTGASFLARRVVFDDTAGTKKVILGPNINGDVNTSVAVRTNAGTTVGRHNWVRTDGTPVGAWFQNTSRVLGRITANAGPAEELTAANLKTILAMAFSDLTGVISATQLGAAAAYCGTLLEATTSVNFNSADTDTAIPIVLPTGFTRYQVAGCRIYNASGTLTTATFGLFTAAAAAGIAVVTSGTACTVSTASADTNNNSQQVSSNNGSSLTYSVASVPNLYFRVQTPQGSAASASVAITIVPLP